MKFSISSLAAALITLPAVLAFPFLVENGATIGAQGMADSQHIDSLLHDC